MRELALAFLVAGFLGQASCVHVNKAALSSANPAIGRHGLAGVPNFGEVTPTLFRGGQPSHEGFEALAKMGVNIVLDLRGHSDSERREVTRLGMRYLSIRWHCPFPRDEAVARFLSLLRENPGQKVFVHCRLGGDRTGLMVATFRMAEQGQTAAEAKKEMEEYGFTWIHHLICPGLASYEENFPHRFETGSAFQQLRSSKASP